MMTAMACTRQHERMSRWSRGPFCIFIHLVWDLVQYYKLNDPLEICGHKSTPNASRNKTPITMSKTTDPENPRICALFDVDGTLTIPRGEVTPEMMDFMKSLSKKITVGIVGGSDLPKQEEQLGVGVAKVFPYNFSQNGLVAYKNGELLEVQTISKHLGEDNVKRLVNWVMKYLADLDIPVKVSCCRCMFACAAIALECT